MVDFKKGSELPLANPLADDDQFFGVNQGGTTKRATINQVREYLNTGAGLQRVNVTGRPYFAKLDGTTDDSAAFSSAISDLAIGGTLVIPATTSGGIVNGLVVNKRISIESDGCVLKQRNSSTVPALTVLNVTGFRMRGVSFNGNKANQSAQTNVIELKNCADFRLTDVDVDGASYCGIRVESNTDAHPSRSFLRRVSATRSGYSGVQLYAASRVTLLDCNCSDNAGFGAFYDSAVAEAGTDITFSGGNYDYNGYEGISLPYYDYTGLLGKCLKAAVRNVSACFNGRNGVTIQGKDKSVVGSVINNNTISGLLVNGKQCSAVGNDLKYNGSVGVDWGDCEDITCTGNQAIGNGDMGIEVNSCLRGCVTGNTVNGNNINVNGFKAGISLHLGTGGYPFTGPTSGIAVTGNYVGPGPNQDFGIYLTNDSTDNVVDGNACVASGAVQDIRSLSQFNTIRPGASRAAHRGALNQIPIASATSITIPDAQEVVFVTGNTAIATITGGNLSAGREITLVFDTSGIQLTTAGNILSAVTGKQWRPLKLSYIKSINKWAIMDTTTF